jgi:uncharacterized protein
LNNDNLNLRILGVDSADEVAGARELTLRTTRGPIPLIFHGAPAASRAVVCISGAIGGFDGPARLYARLGIELPPKGIAIARVNYRAPNDFDECLLDTLAGLSFVKGTGHSHAAIIGHSFGGAVAINAGTLSPVATGVIAISSQLAGAHGVADLSPKPLMLIHGTADDILPQRSSELIFERAAEPKLIRLFEGADHRFSGRCEELFELVDQWLSTHL